MKSVNETTTKKLEWFTDGTGERHDFDKVVDKIGQFIKKEPSFNYQVIVGTDSEIKHGLSVDFVTAIVAHRIGKGGIYLWFRENIQRKYSLQERITEEATRSVEMAWRLRDAFRSNGMSAFEPEVHVDIGEIGKTREMISGISGMVRGSGFTIKIKPDSFAASKVADRHT